MSGGGDNSDGQRRDRALVCGMTAVVTFSPSVAVWLHAPAVDGAGFGRVGDVPIGVLAIITTGVAAVVAYLRRVSTALRWGLGLTVAGLSGLVATLGLDTLLPPRNQVEYTLDLLRLVAAVAVTIVAGGGRPTAPTAGLPGRIPRHLAFRGSVVILGRGPVDRLFRPGPTIGDASDSITSSLDVTMCCDTVAVQHPGGRHGDFDADAAAVKAASARQLAGQAPWFGALVPLAFRWRVWAFRRRDRSPVSTGCWRRGSAWWAMSGRAVGGGR